MAGLSGVDHTGKPVHLPGRNGAGEGWQDSLRPGH
jgi:hypothetical protein